MESSFETKPRTGIPSYKSRVSQDGSQVLALVCFLFLALLPGFYGEMLKFPGWCQSLTITLPITFLRAVMDLQTQGLDCGPVWMSPRMVSHYTHGEPIAMISSDKCRRQVATILGGFLMLASLASTGCQVDVGGQTLPSGYYLSDDVQYYAPGPEFKLAREAAALKEQSAEQISEHQ